MPEAFQVWLVTYVSEESSGWGPGGGYNATGLIVYAMPDAVFDGLQKNGIGYLNQLPFDARRCCEGRYEKKWKATPIDTTVKAWDYSSSEVGQLETPKIGDYLGKWGYPVPLDSDIEAMVDNAISKPGSFYAYGQMRLIILIPEQRRIVFAYAD